VIRERLSHAPNSLEAPTWLRLESVQQQERGKGETEESLLADRKVSHTMDHFGPLHFYGIGASSSSPGSSQTISMGEDKPLTKKENRV
jgi:hypothetical protein